jgi:hypothetical protein
VGLFNVYLDFFSFFWLMLTMTCSHAHFSMSMFSINLLC